MREIAGGTAVAFLLRISGAILSFGFNVLLARLLGAEGAGVYYLAFTVISIATVVGRVGLDNALLRFTAMGVVQEDWGKISSLYRRGLSICVLASVGATIVVVSSSGWISKTVFSEPALASPLQLMALAILPFSLVVLHGELLKGLKKIRDATLVQGLGIPAVSSVLLLPLGGYFGLAGAVLAYVLATISVLMLGVWLWNRNTPSLKELRGTFDTRLLLATSLPLFWVASMNVVMSWTDTLMLGIWRDSELVGIYGVAARTALMSTLILVAVNSVVAPRFAALYARGEIEALSKLARAATRVMVLLALPLLVLFTVFAREVLSIFGDVFVSGALVLAILAAGQFVNVASGSVGYLLMMSGFEKVVRNNILLGASLNIALNLLLIPEYGALGAAVATAVSLAVKNLAAVYLVHKYLSIKMWFA